MIVEESTADTPIDTKSEDILKVLEISNEVLEKNISKEEILQARRLGKFDGNKTRPLLITISTENRKKDI